MQVGVVLHAADGSHVGNSTQSDHSFPLQSDHQKLTGKMEKKMY
jgi:hypothetical protein